MSLSATEVTAPHRNVRREACNVAADLRVVIGCCCFVVCFPGVTTHCGCIFHSPVAGFSLLVFEVS
jgi:hypothetical protein